MKHVLSLITLVVLGTSAAQATSIRPTFFRADLNAIQLDPGNAQRDTMLTGTGFVALTWDNRKLIVQLNRDWGCPNGPDDCVHAAVMLEPLRKTLNVVSSYTGSCGITTTVAEEDHRPVDGGLTRVIVINYTGYTNADAACPPLDNVAAPIVMSYETSFVSRANGQVFSTRSIFGAQQFHAVFNTL